MKWYKNTLRGGMLGGVEYLATPQQVVKIATYKNPKKPNGLKGNPNQKGDRTVQIEITKETAEAILKMNDRYYFGLFKEIVTSEDEEYQFRNAIKSITKEITR